jgi:hypothetical protein
MSVFRKDFLERIKSSKASGVSQQDLKCTSKTVSPQQMACLEAAIKQQRIEREKGGWRPAAKWLEQNCEEYRQPSNGEVSNATNGTRSSILSPNSEPANEPPTREPQPLTNAPESQSAPAALPSPSPIQLPSAFWQALLYGSPDALLSPRDANTALRLVACELGKDSDVVLFTDTVRVNTLRKMLDQQFGAKVWDVMNRLWRATPASPGAPAANEDQSQLAPA